MRTRVLLLLCLSLAPAGACLIRGHGTPTSSSTSASGGAAGAGGCLPAWQCTPWETVGTGDDGHRVCVDLHDCGAVKDKPVESVTLPPLDLDYFKCEVEPILDQKCSMLGCHGTEKGRALRIYARGRKRLAGQTLVNPSCGTGSTASDNCDGATWCLCAAPHTQAEWRKNFDAARGMALDPHNEPVTSTNADLAELLAQPVVGGKEHAGIHLFKKNDAQYAAIRKWVAGAKLNAACDTGKN